MTPSAWHSALETAGAAEAEAAVVSAAMAVDAAVAATVVAVMAVVDTAEVAMAAAIAEFGPAVAAPERNTIHDPKRDANDSPRGGHPEYNDRGMTMKTSMTNKLRAALIAPIAACVFAIGAPSVALAADSPAQVASSSDVGSGGDAVRARKTEARIKHLHDLLKITSEQEAQWSSVAQVMLDNAAAVDGAIKDRAQKAKNINAVDDLLSYQAIVAAHADGLKKLATAFAPLYSVMPEQQQKNADAVFGHRIEASKLKSHK